MMTILFIFDVGDGALGRYRRPDEMMRALQMFTIRPQ